MDKISVTLVRLDENKGNSISVYRALLIGCKHVNCINQVG